MGLEFARSFVGSFLVHNAQVRVGATASRTPQDLDKLYANADLRPQS
jgi:hypothetical protein